jgi:hypothetical protein
VGCAAATGPHATPSPEAAAAAAAAEDVLVQLLTLVGCAAATGHHVPEAAVAAAQTQMEVLAADHSDHDVKGTFWQVSAQLHSSAELQAFNCSSCLRWQTDYCCHGIVVCNLAI